MTPKKRLPACLGAAALLLALIAGVFVIQSQFLGGSNNRAGLPALETEAGAAPTGIWSGLLAQTPYPHTTPLPAFAGTPLDGTYAKIDPSHPQWWACRRCADYRPAGGIWVMQFDKGVMRIMYDVTGWRSIASYSVDGNRVYLYNDPYCPEEVGEYIWNMTDSGLKLAAIDDPCSIRLRGENLGAQNWQLCTPAQESGGGEDQQEQAPGCAPAPAPKVSGVLPDLPVSVVVHPGYAHDFSVEPEVYTPANGREVPPSDAILITSGDTTIPYGLNAVLWGPGAWVQASTERPYESMGVQVYGDHTIGWAEVLFDGLPVWRGDTAAIWSRFGRHGGYIEIIGFEPGMHTLRIESLGFDYRPVTVAFFGFREAGGVAADEP